MKLLDSTFLIDLLKGKKETQPIINTKQYFITTQINMYEVIRGLFMHKAPQEYIRRCFELFEDIRVLPLDDNALIKAAEISATLMNEGRDISDCDCLTAGIALSKGITTIVTKNVKHFQRIQNLKVETY